MSLPDNNSLVDGSPVDSSPIDSTPVDNANRLAALNPLRSICVTAPAGSGKTELLSQRVLKLLASADQPENILAITFTRKAAAEMHHRIIQALRFAKDAPEPEQAHKRLSWQLARDALARDRECHWQLLDNTNRLKIQTIDSFCASLTRQMPILSNFGAQPQITDNPQQCYRLAVHEFLQWLEQDGPFAQDLSTLLAHVDNDMAKVERLLMALLQRRDQWLLHIGIGSTPDAARTTLEHTLQDIIVDVLTQLQAALLPVAGELLPLLDYAGCNIQWQQGGSIGQLAGIIELPAKHSDAVSRWQAIAELLLTKTNAWRKTVDKRAGFPTETQDGDKALAKALKGKFVTLLKSLHDDEVLHQLLMELRHLPASQYDQQQWQLLESLTRLLPGLVAQLTLVFQQQAAVDYSQISMAALEALGDGLKPTELAMKLDHQLHHILVDEFQDTASTQFRLLQRLLEGWQEYNAVNPERPNTLFIVGDGMQSIYGFREANVGLFLEARKQGINGVELDDLPLSVNFRSDPVVVDWVNQTFSQAFPLYENLSRGAVPYERAQAFNATDERSEIALFGFSGDDAAILEAEKTVALVQQAQQQNPDGSIAVLVRSRGHLREIIPAFSKAGLRWSATDIDPLAGYSSIIDVLSLTKALLNNADQLSWCALFRAPWIGLDNTDLYRLFARSDKQPLIQALYNDELLASLSKHGCTRLKNIRVILTAAFNQRYRLSTRSWIEGVWLALGGASTVATRSEFDFIDAYFDLLESYQVGESISSLHEFELAVNNLYAAASTENTNLYVMTIHKSKGLEFDTVILPGMGKATRSDDKSLLMWREYLPVTGGDTGLVISPLAASGNDEDAIYQHLRFEQAQSNHLENTRLFYVAATRAVKQLYVLFVTERDTKTEDYKPPAKNSLLSPAWPVLQESVQWSSADKMNIEQYGLDFDKQNTQLPLQRVQADWQPPVWAFNNPLQHFYLDVDYANEDNTPQLISDRLPACVGTVTHWIFEQLLEKGTDFWATMAADGKQQWLESLLHYHQLPVDQWASAIDDITHAVDKTLADHKGRWLLRNHYAQSASELSLLSSFGQSVKQKIIDRSFIDDKGTHWIVDYKTAKPQQGESKEKFIEREIALYRAQLLDYKLHLSVQQQGLITEKDTQSHKRNKGVEIKTALYFTYYPHWQELEL